MFGLDAKRLVDEDHRLRVVAVATVGLGEIELRGRILGSHPDRSLQEFDRLGAGRKVSAQHRSEVYQRGELIDSIDLGRELTATTFFETYSNPSTLNLAGRAGDTLFVYRFDITTSQTQAAGSDEFVPETFTLHQNNPNPFNGETRLSFETEESQYLSLKVYNILGQEVTTLAEGIFSPGTYYAYWGGANAEGMPQSSGVYFAKLRTDNASQIIKLIFLK